MKQSKNQQETPHIDYDGQWKRIIKVFFEPMTGFFMPELAADIDFSKPPQFLEQELAKIMPEQTAKGRMSIDKLLKVPMKNGEYEHIFFHVEVESQLKPNFPEKNFKYFYQIFDRKGKAITALVIYTSDHVPTPHDRYVYNFRGTELIYKFNTYLVRDADEEELLKSENVFALVILACKYINRTKNNFDLRREFKLKLFKLAFERGYPEETIRELLSFILIVMYLPPNIEKEFKMEAEATKKIDKPFSADDFIMDYFRDYFVGRWGDEVEAEVEEKIKAKVTEQVKAEVTEQVKAEVTEQVKAEVTEQVKAEVTEQVKAEVTEQQTKARTESIRKLILSGAFNPSEIADIIGVSLEEVSKIKAEIDAQD